MAITGATDLGGGLLALTVDADPALTPVSAPSGSLIVYVPSGVLYRKLDDGVTTNVTQVVVLVNGQIPASQLAAAVQSNPNIVRVSLPGGGGSFTSIAAACNSIAGATATNRYLVEVGPGVYTEPQINVPAYVAVTGSTIQPTHVVPDVATHHVFNLSANSEVSFLTIDNAGAGFAGIAVINAGSYAQCHKISMNNCSTGVYVEGSTVDTYLFMEYVDFNGTYSYGIDILSTGGFVASCNTENYYNLPAVNTIYHNRASGSGALLDILASGNVGGGGDTFLHASDGANVNISATYAKNIGVGIHLTGGASVDLSGSTIQNATPGGVGIEVQDGAFLRASGMVMLGLGTGLHVLNVGAAPTVSINAQIDAVTYAALVAHPGTTGSIAGAFDRTKVSIDATSAVEVAASDPVNGGFSTTGSFYLGEEHDDLVDVFDLIESAPPMGLLEGGALSSGAGFVVNVAAGFGYLMSGTFPAHKLARFQWAAMTITLSANVDLYIYWNPTNVLTTGSAFPNTRSNILLGRVITNGTGIEAIDLQPFIMHHSSNRADDFTRDVLGSLYQSGSVVTENALPRKLDVTAGMFFYGGNKLSPAGGTAITWTKIIRNGVGGWTLTPTQDTVPNDRWDDGTGVEAVVPAGQFARHWLYAVGAGATLKRYLVLGQSTYPTLTNAQDGTEPVKPSWIRDGFVRLASVITQQGVSLVSEIRDERPRVAGTASSTATVTDHGSLTGLTDDDHLQYLLVSGARALTGDLDLGGSNVVNVNLVDGVDVPAHAARHLPNGADPLTTAAPTANVTAATANAVGLQNSLARSDHGHAITTAAPVATSVATAPAAGTSASLARADHVHQSNTAPINVTKATAAIGTSGEPARSDHKHDVTTAAASANPPGTVSAEGASVSLARADHAHGLAAFGAAAGTFCEGNDARLGGLLAVNAANVIDDSLSQPPTIAGTVAVTNASAAVTGTGTSFTTTLAVGMGIRFNSQSGTSYTILSIASNTSLTLSAVYTGTTNAATTLVGPREGDAYFVGAAPANSWSGFAQGDLIVWSGTAVAPNNSWKLMAAGVAGLPATGVRAIVAPFQGTAGGSFVGQTGKVATYSGGWSFVTPTAGMTGVVAGNGGPLESGLLIYRISDAKWLCRVARPRLVVGTSSVSPANGADVLASGMMIVPMAGIYDVTWTGYGGNSNSGQSFSAMVYGGGVLLNNSNRVVLSGVAATRLPFECPALATVTGLQAIEGRVNSTGAVTTIINRTLKIVRVE